MNAYSIVNTKTVLPGRIETGRRVVVERGIITAIEDVREKPSRNNSLPEIDGENCYLSPGFVELHIHGCGNASVDAAVENTSVLSRMREDLARYGINTFVPTMMCNPHLLSALAEQMNNSRELGETIPGFYVEGPFVSTGKRGGILPEYVHLPALSFLSEILELGKGYISLMTLAPELEGITEVVSELDRQGIIPCFGHSICTFSQASRLINNTFPRNITHLFNAMSGFSHKEAGLAMLPFLDEGVYVELNGDGVHVNDEMLRLCCSHLNHERLVLISDAVVTSGLYYGKEVVSDERGVRYKDNGTLIGSNLLIPQVVKRFIDITRTPLEEAIPLATLNPCRLLGIESRRGSIEVGKEADLILLDDELNIRRNLTVTCS